MRTRDSVAEHTLFMLPRPTFPHHWNSLGASNADIVPYLTSYSSKHALLEIMDMMKDYRTHDALQRYYSIQGVPHAYVEARDLISGSFLLT